MTTKHSLNDGPLRIITSENSAILIQTQNSDNSNTLSSIRIELNSVRNELNSVRNELNICTLKCNNGCGPDDLEWNKCMRNCAYTVQSKLDFLCKKN